MLMKAILFILILLFLTINLSVNLLKNKENFINPINNFPQQLIKNQPIKKSKYSYQTIKNEYDNSDASLIIFEIIDNNVSIKEKKNIMSYQNSRIKFLLSLFKETLKIYKIKDIIFLVNVNDNIPKLNTPFLGCVYEKDNNCISLPINWCHYFGTKDKLFEPNHFDKSVENYKNESISISDKKDLKSKIVYRGSNNCDIRRKIASLNHKYSDYIDVKLARNKKDKHFIDNATLRKKYDKFFCVRGMGKWTGSLNQFALANGVLFIIEEDCKQPFELLLKPNIDYISIKNDLSNFEENIKLSKNSKLMKNIRDNLKNKSEFFNSKIIMEYIYLCINNLYI